MKRTKYNQQLKPSTLLNKNTASSIKQAPYYEPAEVVDVIMDEKHKRYKAKSDIGMIVFRRLFTDFNKKYEELAMARPSNPYVYQYPLRYETVMIFQAISPHTGITDGSVTFYYDNIVNVWGLTNHNALPFCTISTKKENQDNRNYANFTGNVHSQKTNGIVLGDYFTELPNLPKLKPFEGDNILQGRFGNSIRFSSNTTPHDDNQWSKSGNGGDPIIVIKNNRDDTNVFKYVMENINTDDSSIYMTSSQLLPLKLSSGKQKSFIKSYKPTATNNYKSPQIILNSNRVILNAKDDNVIISSKQSSFITSDNSVNIDAKNYISIDSVKIYIGSVKASNELEPIVLGTQLLNTLVEVIDNLLIMYFGTGVGPTTPMLPPAQTNFISLKTKLLSTKYILSKKIFGE